MRRITTCSEAYASDRSRAEIEAIQLDAFNTMWRDAIERVPFYRSWAVEHGLPTVVNRIQDVNAFPELTKGIIVEREDEIFSDSNGQRIQDHYSTGGTLGTPTRYPRGRGENIDSYVRTYAARGWWNIRPLDPYVHVWGHAHLFGMDRMSRVKRKIQDRLVRATRLDAYDMSPSNLGRHVNAILRRNPTYIIGYTSAIFRIARHIQAENIDVTSLTRLRYVIVTAETVTGADVDLIESVFGVSVVIEYGAAETGVIAYSEAATWPLRVLWKSNLVMVDEENSLNITTLEPRCFPLINYSIGDRVSGGDIVNSNALALDAIVGRSQDDVTVSARDGRLLTLSSILPVHILKNAPNVTSVQYRQASPGKLIIFVSGVEKLEMAKISDHFVRSLKIDHPDFEPRSVMFQQVPAPLLTKAGKHALFV